MLIYYYYYRFRVMSDSGRVLGSEKSSKIFRLISGTGSSISTHLSIFVYLWALSSELEQIPNSKPINKQRY